jgi:hypothetical protein
LQPYLLIYLYKRPYTGVCLYMHPERVLGWNSAAMTEEDAKGPEKLWMELAKERAHLDTECTADEVAQ